MSNLFHDTLPQQVSKVGDEGTVETVGGRASRILSLWAILSANQGESASFAILPLLGHHRSGGFIYRRAPYDLNRSNFNAGPASLI
jgi:hypothetical protein